LKLDLISLSALVPLVIQSAVSRLIRAPWYARRWGFTG
jgi:hypothetical protein